MTGANIRTADAPVITELLRQLQVAFQFTEPFTVRELPHGEEEAQLGIRFDSIEDAAALSHALPLDQTMVIWYDLMGVHDALPGTPSKRGRRVVLIEGRPVTVWREIGVAVGVGHPPTPRPQGVYFAALDSEVRWLPRPMAQSPTEAELDAMPAQEVAELWAQAERGWPGRPGT
jgi:hypothetical protein